jgi:predicted lipid-binding transport protein (Tim44 family)
LLSVNAANPDQTPGFRFSVGMQLACFTAGRGGVYFGAEFRLYSIPVKPRTAVADPHTDWRLVMMRILSKRNLAAIATIALSFHLATPVYAQSAADCAARAERAERGSSGVMGGAAAGAVGGAVFGAIVGDNRKAAKRGAVLGAVAGGATNSYRKNEAYKREYDACMAGN